MERPAGSGPEDPGEVVGRAVDGDAQVPHFGYGASRPPSLPAAEASLRPSLRSTASATPKWLPRRTDGRRAVPIGGGAGGDTSAGRWPDAPWRPRRGTDRPPPAPDRERGRDG